MSKEEQERINMLETNVEHLKEALKENNDNTKAILRALQGAVGEVGLVSTVKRIDETMLIYKKQVATVMEDVDKLKGDKKLLIGAMTVSAGGIGAFLKSFFGGHGQ